MASHTHATDEPGASDSPPENEREAFISLDPPGFYVRHPPTPYQLNAFLTPDHLLFQTTHMGAAEVSLQKWLLVISGLVDKPYAVNFGELRHMPSRTVTAFHECYRSPLQPPTENLWRVGNVTWTGVPLRTLLAKAKPRRQAQFVWSEGLDRGTFAGVEADRYQRDIPLNKAQSDEVVVAYEMNGRPLSRKRGGPVRLVVPGWFGTNSTKWLSRLSVQDCRSPGPFTTLFYNEKDVLDPYGATCPVWKVQTNSMIVQPAAASALVGPEIAIEGWAWSDDGIEAVSVSADGGDTSVAADVGQRLQYSWQSFEAGLQLPAGSHTLMARARSISGAVVLALSFSTVVAVKVLAIAIVVNVAIAVNVVIIVAAEHLGAVVDRTFRLRAVASKANIGLEEFRTAPATTSPASSGKAVGAFSLGTQEQGLKAHKFQLRHSSSEIFEHLIPCAVDKADVGKAHLHK
ncbi:hypothetical protein LTR85_008655 [Meristemomyces frigidus]|nr:hypothetical protein LTR85_008655 [Meristemomyces frigidus]